MELKNEAIKGVKWTSISTLIIVISQLIQFVVLAKLLSPYEFGVLAIINVIINFIRSFVDLGFTAAVIQNNNINNNQLSTLYKMGLLIGLILYVITYLFSPYASEIYTISYLDSYLKYIAITFIIGSFGSLQYALLQKNLKFESIAKIEIIATIVGNGITIILAFMNFGIISVLIGQILNQFYRSFAFFIITKKDFILNIYFNINQVMEIVKFGMYQVGERSINFLSERADQFIIGLVLGASTLGLYNFAYTIVSQPFLILNPVLTKVALPIFSKIQNDKENLKKYYLKIITILALISIIIYLTIVLSIDLIVPAFFGEKWIESILLIKVFSLVMIFRSIANPSGSLLLSQGRADLGFKWNIVLFFISVIGIYLASSLGNILIVSITILLIQIILYFPNYHFLVKPFIGNTINKYLELTLKPLLVAIIIFIIELLVSNYFKIQINYLSIFIKILICISVFSLINNKSLKILVNESKLLIYNKNVI